jgi:uncharacterized protein YdaU (DUF1376 family)
MPRYHWLKLQYKEHFVDPMYNALSWAARGMFYELVSLQFHSGKPLPECPQMLARILRTTEEEFLAVWNELEPLFPIVSGGRENPLYANAYNEALEVSKKRAAAARKRWDNEPEPAQKRTKRKAKSDDANAYTATATETDTATEKETKKREDKSSLLGIAQRANPKTGVKEPDLKENPPSIEEVEAEFREKGVPNANACAQRFLGYYIANGWTQGRDGKKPIKSWKGAVLTWVGRMNDKPESGALDRNGRAIDPETTIKESAERLGISVEEWKKRQQEMFGIR